MGNLWSGGINTNGEYKKVSDITGINFEDGKQYTFQIQNSATIISSVTQPTAGGFLINNSEVNLYTKPAGEDLYIKTTYTSATLNIAE